jgi:hypothetical protein
VLLVVLLLLLLLLECAVTVHKPFIVSMTSCKLQDPLYSFTLSSTHTSLRACRYELVLEHNGCASKTEHYCCVIQLVTASTQPSAAKQYMQALLAVGNACSEPCEA